MKENYTVSFTKNDVAQARLVKAENAEQALAYFAEIEPTATVHGASLDQCNLERRGCPVEIVPDGWQPATSGEQIPEQEQAEHGGETVIYSVEIEPTGYTDDLFNGTLDECIEYIKAHGYTGADDGARIAKIQLDEDGTISSTLDIITADHWEQEQTTADIIRKAADIIKARKDRSAWDRGVNAYALELLDNIADLTPDDLSNRTIIRAALLNGASDWQQYSYGGCALIYDGDIAERLCTPSELKRCRGGEWNLSSRENWLDVQARALRRAGFRVEAAIKEVRA